MLALSPSPAPRITAVELIVRLTDADMAFLDAYAREHGIGSRSEVLHKALTLRRAHDLGVTYAAAWAEWNADEANARSDEAVADGLDAARRGPAR